MSVVQQRKTRPAIHEQWTSPPRPPRRRRRRWWILGSTLGLLAFLWLIPPIVAHSPLLNWIVDTSASDLDGTLTVRSASLGWFSPIGLSGVEVRDARDQSVLEIPQIQGDKSLAAILCDFSKPGNFQLQEPKLKLVVRQDGSNLEDILANYLVAGDEPANVQVALEVVGGSVSINDLAAQRSWQIDNLHVALALWADQAKPLELSASGIMPQKQSSGRFHAELTIPPADQDGQLTVTTEAIPLAMFQSLMGRFATDTKLAGRLTSVVQCRWNGGAPAGEMTVRANVAADDLLLEAPSLGTDQVKLEHLKATGQVTRQGNRLKVEKLKIDSDVGNVSLEGAVELGDDWAEDALGRLSEQTYQLNGQIDLARLAGMLPGTLRIRKDSRITGGQLKVALKSQPGREGMIWQGRIEASNLAALGAKRRLVWEQPILITLAAHQSKQGPVLESLKCKSSFFELYVTGSPENLEGEANFDLSRLSEELGGLVDLGGIQLAGGGSGHFNWKRSTRGDFEADGEFQVRDFHLTIPDGGNWAEDKLLVRASATGRTDFGADSRLDTAKLGVEAGADRLEAQLTQPIPDLTAEEDWPLEVSVRGELDRWLPRLRPWIAAEDWQLAGRYELSAQATASIRQVHVRRARLGVHQLHAGGRGLNIDEPQIELVASGSWEQHNRCLALKMATLASSTLSVQANDVTLAMAQDAPPKLAATLTYQGNLDRLHRWTIDPAAPPKWRMAGQFSGTGQVQPSGGGTVLALDAVVNSLLITDSSGQQFHEPKTRLIARGGYEHRSRSLNIEQVYFASGTLGCNVAGRAAGGDDSTDLQLAGEIAYDLERVCGLLRPYLGDAIHVVGRGSSPVSYRGPLDLAVSQANTGLSWTGANVYGFQFGPGELDVTLSKGVVHVKPLELAVSEGQMTLAPRVRLAPEPMDLAVEPGPLVSQVRINPQMCAHALKYIAPVLADVTTAQGRFSIELDHCRVPLGDPAQSVVTGRMTVHSVEVGPGPLVHELATVLGYASPAKLTRESVIQFQMLDGRIEHRGLELVFPDVTIRTSGAVGVDQSLAIVAEMPVPPKWRGHNVLGSALRDQIIHLPIGGTLEKPEIDRRTLERYNQQFLHKAAQNVLEDEVNKQLDRLLRPQR